MNYTDICIYHQIWRGPTLQSQELAKLATRSMQLQATIQEGALMMNDGANTVDVECVRWQ